MAGNRVFWGIVTAAAVGAVIGMLFAPDEGNKTRKKIKKKTNSLAGELIEALEKSKIKAVTTADQMKDTAQEYKNEAIDKAEGYVDKVNEELDTLR